ncbi:hypothetical protein T07_11418 [Trichinella nelsoni]|uniref:Uncharacterized protein n=1 Tax=Trichinella nelsoni TaxID=6336 RepID=A0A0V0S071_9BILA|nr:hypothetical protein T07_11418 [Trichinella nelsoni]
MPQVRLAASSLMLEPVFIKYQYMPRCTLPQQTFITGLCCPERDRDLQVPTMFRQFWVSLCPVAVHRGLYPFKKGKMARCGWLGGRGGSFLIINGRDGFRFFRTSLFQNRLLFHFVCQVLIHRAAFDMIISLDHQCHIKVGPYGTTAALFILYQNKLTLNNEGNTLYI